jgi:hypothetical protein
VRDLDDLPFGGEGEPSSARCQGTTPSRCLRKSEGQLYGQLLA